MMRFLPFRRQRAAGRSRAAGPLRAGQFPPDEWQIGADLEQFLPRVSDRNGRARGARAFRVHAGARSVRPRSTLLTVFILVAVATLAYFLFLAPGDGALSAALANLLAGIGDFIGDFIGNLFAGLGSTPGGMIPTVATDPLDKHAPPALITSTPTPAATGG